MKTKDLRLFLYCGTSRKRVHLLDIEDIHDIKKNKVYAIKLPDEGVTIKRVLQADGALIMLMDNSNYPRCLHGEKLDYRTIRGRVIWA